MAVSLRFFVGGCTSETARASRFLLALVVLAAAGVDLDLPPLPGAPCTISFDCTPLLATVLPPDVAAARLRARAASSAAFAVIFACTSENGTCAMSAADGFSDTANGFPAVGD